MVEADGQTHCDTCDKVLAQGEHPFCPHGFGSAIVVGDEIDIEVRHGLCHDDGTPRRFRSRADMNKVAKSKGMMNFVQHEKTPGPPKHAMTFGMSGPAPKGRVQR